MLITQQEVKLFDPAFSSPAICSVIFQVLHFPGLAFSVAPWQITTLFESKRRVELKRAGVESSLVVNIKRKKAVTLKNVHGAVVSIDQALLHYIREL